MKLNTRDMEIILILGNAERPLTSSQIVRAGDGLTQSTVQAVMRKLLSNELVEINGVTHSGNVLSRTFGVTDKGRKTIEQKMINDFATYGSLVNKKAVIAGLLATESDASKKKKDIADIEKLLNELKKSL